MLDVPRNSVCAAAVFLLVSNGCVDAVPRRPSLAHESLRVTTPKAAHGSVSMRRRSGNAQAVIAGDPAPSRTGPALPRASVAPPAVHHLRGPTLTGWQPRLRRPRPPPPNRYGEMAVVTSPEVRLLGAPGARHRVGLARLGSRLAARETRHGCRGRRGYLVVGGALLCSSDDARIARRPLHAHVLPVAERTKLPRVDRPEPYLYVKAKGGGPPRFDRLPTEADLAAVRAGDPPKGLVDVRMKGAYWLAVARSIDADGQTFYETVAGRYVRKSDVKPGPKPPMHGVFLGKKHHLPVAFTFLPTQLYCPGDGGLHECGTVDKHARFRPTGTVKQDGKSYLVSGEGDIPSEAVRIARRIPRPEGVGPDERWIHIDLSEQTLVAYEGDRPVLATLVSTGRPGKDTVTGLFHVERKYLTKTMTGHDADGPYEVQRVPWTMYFHGNYAVHGAYWHDVFGRTRSHGCVNVPPADARFLYYWTRPKLPAGWSAMFGTKGAHVYVTGHTPPASQAAE